VHGFEPVISLTPCSVQRNYAVCYEVSRKTQEFKVVAVMRLRCYNQNEAPYKNRTWQKQLCEAHGQNCIAMQLLPSVLVPS